MTTSIAETTSRGWRRAANFFAALLATRGALVGLFVIGLLIRLVLAKRSTGLQFDVSLFRSWSDRMVSVGPAHMYERGHFDPTSAHFVDYTPGYLYVLFVLGKVSRALTDGSPSVFMLKLPAIAADLGVAALVMALAPRVCRPAARGRIPIRFLAAAAILLNPGLILTSAVWGQVDSVLALLVLAAIYVLTGGHNSWPREAGAVALLAIAVATKPQAVLALPVVAVVLIHRHLLGADETRDERWRGAARIALLALVGACVIALMFAPFRVGPAGIPAFYGDAGAVYQQTSLWAFNIWGIVGFHRPDSGADATAVGGISAFGIGALLFIGATVATMVRSLRSLTRKTTDAEVVTFGAVAVTCIAFAVLTREHERYLYLAIAALAPFAGRRPFGKALAVLSLFFFLDVHFAYVLFSNYEAVTLQPVFDAMFGTATDAWQRKVLSAATAAICIIVAARGWRWLDRDNSRANDPPRMAERVTS